MPFEEFVPLLNVSILAGGRSFVSLFVFSFSFLFSDIALHSMPIDEFVQVLNAVILAEAFP